MGFQAPITIREAVDHIHQGRWVIPGFQRGLVWKPEAMELLFDSLMRDYPIRSFLLWELNRRTAESYPFFEFVREYHGRDRRSGDLASLRGRDGIRAVLDGQQRLTALYIGLRGSFADRLRYGRYNNPGAWPRRVLHLGLAPTPETEALDDPDAREYQFRFLPPSQARASFWFPVPEVLGFREPADAFAYLASRGLEGDRHALQRLFRLREVVWSDPRISVYLEPAQSFHKVVTVFQRLNKEGKSLTTAEVVFATVVEQWHMRGVDARREIDDLLRELNQSTPEDPFRLTRDFVLKACLVLSDAKSIRFNADSYSAATMAGIHEAWQAIKNALRLAVGFLKRSGYTGLRLTGANAVIPIAYYLLRLGCG